MKCPVCGSEMEHGFIEALDKNKPGVFSTHSNMTWFPDSERGKIFMKHGLNLSPSGGGYRCKKCNVVYAEFDAFDPRYD